MFEVGQTYTIGFVSYDDGGQVDVTWRPNCEAIRVDMPLVTFRQGKNECIINTSNPTFVGTQLP